MFIINWGDITCRLDPTSFRVLSVFGSNVYDIKQLGAVVEINPTINLSMLSDEDEISFVPMENVDSNLGEIKRTLLKKKKQNKGFTKFQNGDLLWAKITPCMQNGKSAIANNLINGYGCGSTEFYVIRPKTKKILPKYIHFILRDERILKNAENFFGGSAGQQRVSKNYLVQLPIPVPPVEIQQQIINILDAAYTVKQQKEKEAKELLDSINCFLLGELGIAMPLEEDNTLESRKFCTNSSDVLGGRFDPFYYKPIFDKYDEELNDGKYTVCKLGKYIHYITYGASVDNSYQEAGIPLLRIKDLTPNEINSDDIVYLPLDMEKELRTSRVNLDDLLITRSGTIGVCSVVDKKHSGFAFGSFMIKFTLFCINPQYVSYYVNSIIGQEYFGRNKIGAIQGNITIPTIKSLPIPIPDPHIQTQIVEKINFIRSDAKKLEQEADDAVKSAKAKVEKILLEGSL